MKERSVRDISHAQTDDHRHKTPDPHSIREVLSELFARRGYGRVMGDQQLREAWQSVAGDQLARKTRVRCLRNGTLEIGVASSALLSQLVSFQRQELLQALQTQHPHLKIRDVKFKLQSSIK